MCKKTLIIIALSMLTVLTACQTPAPPEMLKYQKVIEVPNTSKDELFTRVNVWAVSYFKSAESVIEYSDNEQGIIAGKYVSIIEISLFLHYVKQTIQIYVKDSKVMVVITEPMAKLNDSSARSMYGTTVSYRPVTTVEAMEVIRKEWNKTVSELEKSLNQEIESW